MATGAAVDSSRERGPILFFSTNDWTHQRPGIDFADALMKGLAPDKGLFMMDRADLPRISESDFRAFRSLPYHEIAFRILTPFVRSRVRGLMDNEVADYQASALLMAIFLRGMDFEETAWLTREIDPDVPA